MSIDVGQFAAWALAATLIGGAVIGVLAFVTWEQIRRGHDPAGALQRFVNRWVGVSIVPLVVLSLIAAQDPAYWRTHLHLQLLALIWASWSSLIVLSLALKLAIERKVRPAGWSAMAMFQVQVYFLMPLLGSMGAAIVGSLATVWIAGLLAYGVPMWVGAMWLVVAMPLVMLAPTTAWLGRRMPVPEQVMALYREKLDWSQPPHVVVLDTRGARFANAFSFWRPGRRWIAVTDGALERLTSGEVMHLLLHETGHHVHQDSRRFFLALMLAQTAVVVVLLVSGLANLMTAMMGFLVMFALVVSPLTRRAERRADRFVVEHGGDPQVYGEALRKLHAANLLPARADDSTRHTHPDLVERLELIGAPMSEEEAKGAETKSFTRSGTIFDLMLNLGFVLLSGFVSVAYGLLIPLGAVAVDPISVTIAAVNTFLLYRSVRQVRVAMRRLSGKVGGDGASPVLLAALVTYWPVVIVIAEEGPIPAYLPFGAAAIFASVWWLAHRYHRARQVREHGASPVAKQPVA